MLARQAWRLIYFSDSLCAKLLKAKYYPNGNLIDTAFCTNPSSTWQSILHGLDLLKQGVIWRIGNGSQERIWRDPWIPMGISHKVVTSQGRCRWRWISDLLDQSGRDWDYDRLAHVFCSTDAEAIAKIKLLARPSDDFIAWSLEKTGLFSVRSAYNLALKLKTHQSSQSSSSAPDGDRKLWSHIWAGGVPPKVNIFVWKLSRDALPMRRNKFDEVWRPVLFARSVIEKMRQTIMPQLFARLQQVCVKQCASIGCCRMRNSSPVLGRTGCCYF
jgi:hypothetical protein